MTAVVARDAFIDSFHSPLRYRASFQEYVGNHEHRKQFVPVDNMAWLTFKHLVNLRVLPHVDNLDASEGWAGMTCVGEYDGKSGGTVRCNCSFQSLILPLSRTNRW
jgi:hypothetical protein